MPFVRDVDGVHGGVEGVQVDRFTGPVEPSGLPVPDFVEFGNEPGVQGIRLVWHMPDTARPTMVQEVSGRGSSVGERRPHKA